MRRRSVASAIAIAVLTLSPVAHAQTPAGAQAAQGRGGQAGGRRGAAAAPAPNGQNENIHIDGWNKKQESLEASGKKPGPAPVHDLSGIWEPVPRYRDGVFASGPRDMPSDAAHEAAMPYTPMGKQAMLAQRQDLAALDDALNALPVAWRECLILRELEQLSYKQIARVADIPIGTVMSRLSRARQALQREPFGDDRKGFTPKNGKEFGQTDCLPAPVIDFGSPGPDHG